MEIVSIEKKTFEMMVASFNALAEKVAALRRRSDGGRMERWLTGEEVCGQLRISPRTLQTLRDRRLIGYSQINRRRSKGSFRLSARSIPAENDLIFIIHNPLNPKL